MLDAKDILNPASHRCKLKNKPINLDSHWSNTAVRSILTNPIYTGDMVQGRTKSYSHKANKRIPLLKEQWDVVPNTHEPIVSKTDYEMVQILINKKARPMKRKYNTKPSILADFLFCADYGKKMQRRITTIKGRSYYNFSCSTYKKLGKDSCSSHLIREDVIIDVLLKTINTIIQSIIDVEQTILNNRKNEISKMVAKSRHQIDTIRTEIEKIEKIKAGLYSDYKMDVISLDDYKEMKKRFEDKLVLLNQQTGNINDKIKTISCDTGLNSDAVRLFKQYKGIEKLNREINREIIGALVNKIIIDHERNIEIEFKFQDEIKYCCSFF